LTHILRAAADPSTLISDFPLARWTSRGRASRHAINSSGHTLIPCQPSPGRPRLAAQAADRGPYFPTGKT